MVSFKNPEFVYIFTVDVGGYIKLPPNTRISDLENFKVIQLRRENPETQELSPADSSGGIIDENFFKQVVLGKWIAKDEFIDVLEKNIKRKER